jgi:hypothetical protein
VSKFNRKVQKARINSDHDELSRLGKKGAQARKAKKKEEEQAEIARLALLTRQRLIGARKMLRQANEDICPIDD